MNSNKILGETLHRAGVSRRDIGRWLGASGLALTAMPITRRPAQAEESLLVFEWSGYELPEFHPAYTAKHGVSPDFGFFADQQEAFTKVRAGYSPDLVHPCASQAWKWWDAGFAQPIDVAKLSNWGQVWPTLQTMPGVRSPSDEVILVPFDWGNVSFCYRTDLVDITPETESWTAILDPKYAGKMSVDQTEDNFRGVALAIGIKNVTSMTPDELQLVKAALIKQKELVRFYWAAATDLAQAFTAGEIVISTCWNETSAKLLKEGVPVRMAQPKEGVITWVCGLVHLKQAENDPVLAYDFMDAFISKESGAYLIDEYGYGHSNQEAFKLVSPERLAELGISDPDAMMAKTILSGAGQDFEGMNKIISEVEAGS